MLPLCRARGSASRRSRRSRGGWLTGKYRRGEAPPQGSRMTLRPGPYEHLRTDAVFDGLEAFERAAAARGVDSATLAFAWLLSSPDVTAVVVGPRRPAHLEPRAAGARARAVGGRPRRARRAAVILAHLDLDAFFAAVEEIEQPELKRAPARRRRRPARPRRRRDRELRRAPLRDPLRDELRRGAAPLPAGRLRAAARPALPRVLARGLADDPRRDADRGAGRDRRGLPRHRRGRRGRLARGAEGRRGGADVGARGDEPLLLARRGHVQGGREGRLRPAQAGRAHRRARPGARPRSSPPFDVRLLPGVGPEGGGAARRRGRGDDRRARGASPTTS